LVLFYYANISAEGGRESKTKEGKKGYLDRQREQKRKGKAKKGK
jgi:hypothetical protein